MSNTPKFFDKFYILGHLFSNSLEVYNRVARSKKIKKAKFGHKQFQKRPNPEK